MQTQISMINKECTHTYTHTHTHTHDDTFAKSSIVVRDRFRALNDTVGVA
jgi:hypothetical protein